MAKILIVDDSGFQRSFLRKALTAASHDVIEAADGAQGLEKVATERPDCVLADLIMDKMRGLTMLASLRERQDRTPVVILTSDIQDAVRKRCLELGAFAVLHKPVNPVELLETIAQAMADQA